MSWQGGRLVRLQGVGWVGWKVVKGDAVGRLAAPGIASTANARRLPSLPRPPTLTQPPTIRHSPHLEGLHHALHDLVLQPAVLALQVLPGVWVGFGVWCWI